MSKLSLQKKMLQVLQFGDIFAFFFFFEKYKKPSLAHMELLSDVTDHW